MINTLSISRYEMTSRRVLGKNNRSAKFYATGAMWNAKKEAFLKDIDIISSLNIKASIGTSGNSSIGNYANLALVGTNQYNATTGWNISTPGNPDLGWGKTKTKPPSD